MTSRQPTRRTIIQSFRVDKAASVACASPLPTRIMPSHEASDLPAIGDIVGGCYRLVRLLGEGRFGRVYVAERTDVPEHRVALKVMSKKVYAGRNVTRELVMLAAASHPHIVQLKDHGTSERLVWLTMPLYQGQTLAERLSQKPLSLHQAHRIFVPIARGLQSLHERGLRHQDVKPDNVFLADFGGQLHPMLLDLGVAVEKNASFVAGTALYAAPEQFAALSGMVQLAELSEKVDGYGLAATLLHALVGDAYFPGEDANTPLEVANAFDERASQPLRDGALPELSGAPRQHLNAALARWLCVDPQQRPGAGSIADELDVLLEQAREAAMAIERAMLQQKQSLLRVRLALAGAAMVGVVGALYGYSKRETLRLANELQHARAQGAASFDQLDTCAAAHRLSQQNVSACQLARDDERSAHQRALSGILHDKKLALAGLQKRLDRSATRLRSCRDEVQDLKAQHQQAEEKWQATTLAQQKACEGERASFQKAASAREEALRMCRQHKLDSDEQRDSCRDELASVSKTSRRCNSKLSALQSSASQCEIDRASAVTAHQACERSRQRSAPATNTKTHRTSAPSRPAAAALRTAPAATPPSTEIATTAAVRPTSEAAERRRPTGPPR